VHPFSIKAEFTLGFLGGGQLARMSAYQAYRFGIQTAVYRSGSTPEPMDFVSPFISIGAFADEKKLIDFAKSCDVVTLENEFLESDLLKHIRDKSGTPIYPSPETFELIENKWIEKETFRKARIPVTPYRFIKNNTDIESFGNAFGWPFVLKSSKGGYDGYISSFIGFPVNVNKKFVVMAYIDHPTQKGYYGGVTSAPIFKKVTQYILYKKKDFAQYARYDEKSNKDNLDEVKSTQAATIKTFAPGLMPDFTGMDKSTALALAEERKIKVQVNGFGIVKQQSVTPGTSLSSQSVLRLQFEAPTYAE